jgi:hypothetical protein
MAFLLLGMVRVLEDERQGGGGPLFKQSLTGVQCRTSMKKI